MPLRSSPHSIRLATGHVDPAENVLVVSLDEIPIVEGQKIVAVTDNPSTRGTDEVETLEA